MGLLQDPQLRSGLKNTSQALKEKCHQVGSDKIVVKILTYLLINPIILAFVFVPVEASACGFFNFDWLSCFTGENSTGAEVVESNSQNMPLLQAIVSPNQDASSTKKELAIVGGTSLLPETESLPEIKTANDDQISLYVVHSGDTLPAIAKMFGVSVNTIRWGNDINGNTITVGQTLVILPISGVQHIVKSGDTLQSIAKQHKGDLLEILQYNNLTKDSKLAVGDIITVPDGEVITISKPSSVGIGKSGPSYPVYDGYYMRPIIGGIKTQGIHGHNGVDLASSYGSNILASAEGQVLLSRNSGYNGGYGSYIVIKHSNGTQTLYGHLSATVVNVGDNVFQGQVIGKMGRTGKATGVHLHFEIRGARNPF